MLGFVTVLIVCVAVIDANSVTGRELFEAFKAKHQRHYPTRELEEQHYQAFTRNTRISLDMQRNNKHATFDALHPRADRIHRQMPPFPRLTVPSQYIGSQVSPVPKDLDWVKLGAVTPVQNMGQCAASWAFAIAANIEGVYFVKNVFRVNKTSRIVPVSEQQLMDCVGGGSACSGMIASYANVFNWIIKDNNGTVASAAKYPYVNHPETCRHDQQYSAAKIVNYVALPANNESAILKYVAQEGPVAAMMYGVPLETYTGGIISDCPKGPLDTMVTIVGYNTTSTTPYWIVKNQWGTSWGLNGYFYIAYGTDSCSIGAAAGGAIAGTL